MTDESRLESGELAGPDAGGQLSGQALVDRCGHAAGYPGDEPLDPDGLIGFFQQFRPDGRGLAGLFDDLPAGGELHRRLDELFAVAGDDRRPQGGRDAYFIIRNPSPIDPSRVQSLAERWIEAVRKLAAEVDDDEVGGVLDPAPAVRVLEGLPPKHPKNAAEKTELLKAFEVAVPALVERIEPESEHAAVLRPAYYFVNCNPMLRDYLMWPLYAAAVDQPDPFAAYFELWKHGIKYRIFQETQIDFYMPRL